MSKGEDVAILGVLIGFIAAFLGWQVNLVAIHNGLRHGRLGVFFTGLGAAVADSIILVLGFIGVGELLEQPGWQYTVKVLSLITIIGISARMFFYRPDPDSKSPSSNKKVHSFLMGFLLMIAYSGVVLPVIPI